jgi:C4-dicarboxylate-specific signal transduction histidine kinase
VQRILRDGNRAAEVIARIRALLAKGQQVRQRLRINDVIEDLLPLVDAEVRRRGAKLERHLADGLPAVEMDRVQIQQVMMNLMVNGLDAMGGITDRPRLLRVRTSGGEQEILIAVEDSGVGLDDGTIDRLFDPFFTTKTEGLGMGLAICRSIAESHGGRLHARANDGHGATFHFTLPLDGGAG